MARPKKIGRPAKNNKRLVLQVSVETCAKLETECEARKMPSINYLAATLLDEHYAPCITGPRVAKAARA